MLKYESVKTRNTDSAEVYLRAAIVYICIILQLWSLGMTSPAAAYGGVYIIVDFCCVCFAKKRTSLLKKLLPPTVLLLPFVVGFAGIVGHISWLANGAAYAIFRRYGAAVRLFAEAERSEIAACGLCALLAFLVISVAKSQRKPVKIIFCTVEFAAAIFLANAAAVACLAAAMLIFSKRPTGDCIVKISSFAAIFALLFGSAYFQTAAENVISCAEEAADSSEGYKQPNGNLADAAAFSPQNTLTLEIVADQPEAMYLHGFLGYEYSEGAWNGVDREALSEQLEEIYTLSELGFDAAGQTRKLVEADGGFEKNTVTVTNICANSGYCYLPALALDSVGNTLSLDYSQTIFKRSQSQEFEALSDSCTVSPTLTDAAARQVELQNEEFINCTALLDEIYSKNFTTLSDEVRRILDVQLAEYECNMSDITAATGVIRHFFTNFSYDTSATGTTLEDFLQTTRSGYSIHFASAATAILRYYGIPARYAEGFVVTSESEQGKLSGTPITLTDADFHAWVEYYSPGVGWIPLEVTPNYIEKMPMPEGVAISTENSEQTSNISQGITNNNAISGERTAMEMVDKATPEKSFSLTLPIIALVVVFVVGKELFVRWRIKSDLSYAVYRCRKLLSEVCKIELKSGGIFEPKLDECEIKRLFMTLQKECCDEYYAHIDKKYTNDETSLKVYKTCLKYVLKNKKIAGKIFVIVKEIFTF